jgi:hypothetical protein
MPRPRFFGQFLLERDVITPQALLKALSLQDQNNEPIGSLAIRRGLLTREDVTALHREQRTTDMRIGELAVGRGMLEASQADKLLDEQRRAYVRLGEALIRTGALTREVLERELAVFEAEQLAEPVSAPLEPHSALVERTLRLTQTLFQRLARVTVKLGGVSQTPNTRFAHSAMAEIGPARLYLAYDDAIARKVTIGMLGFEPDNIEPADMTASLSEFLTALATQLGATSPAQSVRLPQTLPAGARLFEFYTANESVTIVFDLR